MPTLVIQLGRLGDVIQTTPLLQELSRQLRMKCSHSETAERIELLVVQPNQEGVHGFEALSAIRTVGEDLKSLDDQIARGFRQGTIPDQAQRLLARLNLPRYDRVINASHAALGCWLAGEIRCDAREGGVISREGECLYKSEAHTYRVALLEFREQNWFNLVDLLRFSGPPRQRLSPGLSSTASPLYVNVSEGLPFALPPGRRVALNVGANEKHRRWPAGNFAWLAESLRARELVPILVGAPSDHEAATEVQAASSAPIEDFAGKTSIPEMARVLAGSDLLVTADTGAAYLAAAVGTKVLGLYGATAYFAETSPYGEGHLILQTLLGRPLSDLSSPLVVAGALYQLGLLDCASLRSELEQGCAAAWKTALLPAGADPLGGLCYWPCTRSSGTRRTCSRAPCDTFLRTSGAPARAASPSTI